MPQGGPRLLGTRYKDSLYQRNPHRQSSEDDNHHHIDFFNSLYHATQEIIFLTSLSPIFCHRTLLCPPPLLVHGILLINQKLNMEKKTYRTLRELCSRRLPNRKLCLKRTLRVFSVCSMFNNNI